jgi:hypothetical protein
VYIIARFHFPKCVGTSSFLLLYVLTYDQHRQLNMGNLKEAAALRKMELHSFGTVY